MFVKEDEGCSVFLAGYSGCISSGETKQEALSNIRESIELYFEDNEKEKYEFINYPITAESISVEL